MSGITLTEVANSTIPTPASGKATVFMSTDEGAPAYKDDTGTVTSLEGAAGAAGDSHDAVQDHGAMGAAETFDLASADFHIGELDDDTVLTFSGATNGVLAILAMRLVDDGAGTNSPTFPASVVWPDGEAPTFPIAAGEAWEASFVSTDGGTTWYGHYDRPGPGVPSGGTADQILAKASGSDFDTEWVDAPAAGAPPIRKRVSSTAGDITMSSTAYAAVNSGLDLTFSSSEVAVGDLIGVTFFGLAESSGSVAIFKFASMVSGSAVNDWDSAASEVAWRVEASSRKSSFAMVYAVVVSGDLDSGALTLRFFYKLGSATNKTLYRSAGLALTVEAINFRH